MWLYETLPARARHVGHKAVSDVTVWVGKTRTRRSFTVLRFHPRSEVGASDSEASAAEFSSHSSTREDSG